MTELPREFQELWTHAALLLSPSRELGRSKIRVLPPSLQRAAEHVEESRAYKDLLRSAPWGVPGVAPWKVGQALRRAGFYNAVQYGDSREAVWESFIGHLREYTTTIRRFVLLDGTRFPVDRFAVGGASVQRLSVSDLEAVGPPAQVARTFFPNEYLDPKWFSQVWFLITEENRSTKPTGIYVRFGYDALKDFWKPLIALALYSPAYFATPIVIESEAGWRLERVRWADPMFDVFEDEEIPRSDYCIKAEETERFLAFLQFFEKAILTAGDSSAFRIASRRHLRGLSIGGPHAVQGSDEYEDALLQYVFALEALLMGGDTGAVADKIATRCAWIVGTDDQSRGETFRAVKLLYRLRSAVVHGDSFKKAKRKDATATPDLDVVRDLVRLALLGVLAIRQTVSTDEECRRVISSVSVDRGSQEQIGRAIEAALGMVQPLPDWRMRQ